MLAFESVLMIAEILGNPDNIVRGSKTNRIVFEKRVNGTIYVMQTYKPRHNVFDFETMWKQERLADPGK